MTICIAAIGRPIKTQTEEAIVLASDHMLTLSEIGHFESALDKYQKIGFNTVAMLSGNAILFEDSIKGVKNEDDVKIISEKIHKNMISIRDTIIQANALNKFKLDDAKLFELLKLPTPNSVLDKMLEDIATFNLKTSILLTGFVGEEGSIMEINENGIANLKDIGFNAIGSGSTQAVNTMMFQRHSKKDNLKAVIYNVYKAKRNAEVAEGVGKETTLSILKKNGTVTQLNPEKLKILSDLYDAELAFGKTSENLNKVFE